MPLGLPVRLLLVLLLGASVVSCQTTEELLSVRGSGDRMFGSVLNADLNARGPDGEGPYGIQRVGEDGTTAQVYPGTPLTTGSTGGPFVPLDGTGTGAGTGGGGGSYRLNFENAQLGEVVRAILGDSLGLNYVIDPEVSGRVTLASARPVSRDDLIPILEAVLRINQAVLVNDGAIYRIVYDTEARNVPLSRANAPNQGYGISAVPLRFVSAQTLLGLVQGFATSPDSIRVDATRNLLLIAGTSAERRIAVDTVLSFDTDWMADQSVAIYPTRNVRPETMIPELERIFETQSGQAGADLIQFMPMARLKAVLVVSKRPDMLSRAGTWVSRLDQQSSAVETSVHVYRVKYRDAKLLVEILAGIFGGSAVGPAPGQAAADQIQPGLGVFQTGVEEEEDGAGLDTTQPGLQAPDQQMQTQTGDAGAPILGGGTGTATVDLFSTETTVGATGQPRFSADTANNSVIVFADGETYRKILAALRQIDVPPLQVAVNVVIAEIRLNDELRYGVQYFVKSGSVGLKDDVGSIGLFNTVANTINRELPGFNFVIGSEESPDVIISAFDKITDVSVLSSPSLVVVENQTATLQVGEEVPVTTRQAQSVIDPDAPTVNEIEFRDTGIILNVTPRIAENGVISMTIQQEISNIASGASTLTPTFNKRRISSVVSVTSGQTVLLGGLISENSDSNDFGLPGLHRLKGVGALFGTTEKVSQRNELIVLIRPTVIRQGQDAQNVAEELRARMWNMQRQSTGRQ